MSNTITFIQNWYINFIEKFEFNQINKSVTPFNISNADFYSTQKLKSIMANFTPYHTYLP